MAVAAGLLSGAAAAGRPSFPAAASAPTSSYLLAGPASAWRWRQQPEPAAQRAWLSPSPPPPQQQHRYACRWRRMPVTTTSAWTSEKRGGGAGSSNFPDGVYGDTSNESSDDDEDWFLAREEEAAAALEERAGTPSTSAPSSSSEVSQGSNLWSRLAAAGRGGEDGRRPEGALGVLGLPRPAGPASRVRSPPSPVPPGGNSTPRQTPSYEVLRVKADGSSELKQLARRSLLHSSGLRPRDLRHVDPSLVIYENSPVVLVRKNVWLVSVGLVRACIARDFALLFDPHSASTREVAEALKSRLGYYGSNSDNSDNDGANGQHGAVRFELEALEAILMSVTQDLDVQLNRIAPKVQHLLRQVPERPSPGHIDGLRSAKQSLVEIGSHADSLRQMLMELLEEEDDIARMADMPFEQQEVNGWHREESKDSARFAGMQEEEVEMLLEYYLERAVSCNMEARKLLAEARDMEASIAVNISSRRYEVQRLELLLTLGTYYKILVAKGCYALAGVDISSHYVIYAD
eukprot:jgi/Chlat1/7426/Chrsp6S07492